MILYSGQCLPNDHFDARVSIGTIVGTVPGGLAEYLDGWPDTVNAYMDLHTESHQSVQLE